MCRALASFVVDMVLLGQAHHNLLKRLELENQHLAERLGIPICVSV